MFSVKGFAAQNETTPLAPFSFERKEPGDHDVLIDILFCGVCHSDIHQVRNEWGNSIFPMVPGHEIVGRISKVGARVTKLKVGDIAGVGCLVIAAAPATIAKKIKNNIAKTVGRNLQRSLCRWIAQYGGYSSQITWSMKNLHVLFLKNYRLPGWRHYYVPVLQPTRRCANGR